MFEICTCNNPFSLYMDNGLPSQYRCVGHIQRLHLALRHCNPEKYLLHSRRDFAHLKCNSSLPSISSTFFLYECHFGSFFSTYVCTNVVSVAFFTYIRRKKAAKMTFVRKKRTKNVDEIDTFLNSSMCFHGTNSRESPTRTALTLF
jgi:hypothetical protein